MREKKLKKIEVVVYCLFDSDSWAISQVMVIEQQKSTEIVLSKESLKDRNRPVTSLGH